MKIMETKLYINRIKAGFKLLISAFILAILSFSFSIAQEEEEIETEAKPIRPPFESSWLIENHTTVVPTKGTFEFMIQHRFGELEHGFEDLFGLWLPSNIRLGFAYSPLDFIQVGFGTTKNRKIQDFYVKYAFLKQTRSGSIPVSVTYYGNMAVTTLEKNNFFNDTRIVNESDRFSYFHQVLISRKFTPSFSVQVAPSWTHFNVIEDNMENDHIAIAAMGRLKFSPQGAVIINYDQPLTAHDQNNPNPSVAFGIEIATSSHAFQIFASQYTGIIPQQNNVFNRSKQYVIGFNITRLWNF